MIVTGRKIQYLILAGLLWSAQVDSENLLQNSGFEQGQHSWEFWGGILDSSSAHKGKRCVGVTNKEFTWSGAEQIVPLPSNARVCEISGWMKTVDVVAGKEEWEQAQITIEFVDETNEMVGDYPPKTAEAVGTTEWTRYSKLYSVQSGARGVKVVVALGNATGTAFFDDLSVTAKDSDGKTVTAKLLKTQQIADREKQSKAESQLLNGGFEDGVEGWEATSNNQSSVAHSGGSSLVIESRDFEWKGVEQRIAVPANAFKMVVSGWLKADTVTPGKEEWSRASMTVEFQNAGGGMIGEYPPVVGEIDGVSDWKYYQKAYRIRPGTVKVLFTCALDGAKGRVFYDDIKAALYDADDKPVKSLVVSGPTDEGLWYALDQANTASGGHYVNWSGLLDAPAGKHGFLKVKGDQFVFADGTPTKFIGVVLCAPHSIVDKQKVDSLTTRLAKMGCNMLRLHHLDAEWAEPNIFGNAPGTRKLSEESLKKIDYLIYSCKKKGIYLFLDILVNRQFFPLDSVEEQPKELGAKQVGFFSKRLIELQKEYAFQFLTHKNTYTGLAYKDDPAVALSEFINETTIFTDFGTDLAAEGPYRKELEELWNKSKFAGKKLAGFELKYDADPRGILSNTVEGADVGASIEFLMNLERQYYTEMLAYYRSFGVKYPLAGSNMPIPILALIKANDACDFVANDAYWDHPQLWKIEGGWDRVKYAPIGNLSQFLAPRTSSIEAVSYYRVMGKPYFLWGNHSYPSEYQIECMPLLATYACLQGWNGIFQHEFDHTPLGADSLESFTVSRQPEAIAMWVVSAPMFLRGDIKTAPGMIVEKITDEMLFSDSSYSDFIGKNYFLPYVTRVAKTFDGQGSGSLTAYRKYYDEENQIFRSETGELILDSKSGVLQMNALKVQGALGFIKEKQLDFPLFSVSIKNTHASVIAVSADGKPLTESKHYYLVVAGPSKMTGQQFKPSRAALKTLGGMPVLQQVIEGSLVFKNRTGASKLKVVPLMPNGSAGAPMALTASDKGMELDLGKGRSYVYDVTVGKVK